MDKMDNVMYVVSSFYESEKNGTDYDVEFITPDIEQAKEKMRRIWDERIADEGIDFSGHKKSEGEMYMRYWDEYFVDEFIVRIDTMVVGK